jgi:hypothetical protein
MRFRRAAALVGPICLLLLTLPAAATTATPVWQSAKVVSLPSGATGLPNGFLPALSCPSAGNCSAGGAFDDAAGNVQGLLLSEVKGIWKTPIKLLAPAGADKDPGLTINALSCGSAGNCAAVGSYYDTHGNLQSLVANEVGGAWKKAEEVALPGTHPNVQLSEIHSVDCWSPGNCSAIGSYLDDAQPTGRAEGLEVNEVKGVWARAQETKVPANANVNPYVAINQVTCPHSGDCVAVGSYISNSNATEGIVITEVNGAWKNATSIALPADASAYPSAALSEVACVSAGNCTAIGTYTDAAGDVEGMTVVDTRGAWARALAMAMPSGAAPNPHTFFYGYGGLSCPSIGNCSAGGQYLVGTSNYEGFFVTETSGTWHAATEMSLPAGSLMAGKNGGVVAVSCRSAGNCSAGAAYVDSSNSYQALVINEVDGLWQIGQKITLPTGNNTVGVDGGVYGLICHATGPCTATGSYLKTLTNYEGFTVTTN